MPAEIHATPPLPGLSPVCGKPILARFDGGSLSSDGGLLALREVEERLGVARHLAACIGDPRAPSLSTGASTAEGWSIFFMLDIIVPVSPRPAEALGRG